MKEQSFIQFTEEFIRDCEQYLGSNTTNKGLIVIAVNDPEPNNPNGEIEISHCILGGKQVILSALSGILDDPKDNITTVLNMAVARKGIDIYDIELEEDHED